MAEPRTSREALIAHMLGELDDLLIRAERLPESIAEAEARLAITAQVLNEAGEKYRLAVTVFTEEAKSALTSHVEHRMAQALKLAVEEQRALIEDAIKSGLHPSTTQGAVEPSCSLPRSFGRFRYIAPKRFLEHLTIAALTSLSTLALFVFFVEHS